MSLRIIMSIFMKELEKIMIFKWKNSYSRKRKQR
jgi:hypothetical protein